MFNSETLMLSTLGLAGLALLAYHFFKSKRPSGTLLAAFRAFLVVLPIVPGLLSASNSFDEKNHTLRNQNYHLAGQFLLDTRSNTTDEAALIHEINISMLSQISDTLTSISSIFVTIYAAVFIAIGFSFKSASHNNIISESFHHNNTSHFALLILLSSAVSFAIISASALFDLNLYFMHQYTSGSTPEYYEISELLWPPYFGLLLSVCTVIGYVIISSLSVSERIERQGE